MHDVIGVDLGGTHLRVARMNRQGQVQDYRKVATAALSGPDVVIGQIVSLVEAVIGATPRDEIIGVGVGAPGPLNLETGVVRQVYTLLGWLDIPLRARLVAELGLPVVINNDANAAALGEWRFGAGRGCTHFVYVTVSTGIGGGVLLDGKLALGRNGMAAEVGHMIVDPCGPQCSCGNFGCWEAHASGSALARAAVAAASQVGGTSLRAIDPGALTARHVIDAARAGDALAIDLVRDEGFWLGIGIVSLLHLYSPERVALGGGVAQALPDLLPHIRAVLAARALVPFQDVPIVPAQLGDQAGAIGAAALALETANRLSE